MAYFLMYSVKDEMTGKFMSPMFVEAGETEKEKEAADRLATRQFKSNLNNIQLWKDNANDYSLFRVGMFNDETGSSSIPITKVCSGRSVLNA